MFAVAAVGTPGMYIFYFFYIGTPPLPPSPPPLTAATDCGHPLLRCPTWASRGDCEASALPHTRGVGTMPLLCHTTTAFALPHNNSFSPFFFDSRCHRDCCDQRHVTSQFSLVSHYLSPHTEKRSHPGAVTCAKHITHACHLAADP